VAEVVVQVVQPGRKPIRVVVTADLEVGRDCDGLLLGDPRTSRRHATLMANAGGLTVLDMGSSNGTFVNGTRIVGPTPISPNDIVAVGDTTITLVAPPAASPSHDTAGARGTVVGPPTLAPDGRVRARDSGERFTSIDRVASGMSTEDPNLSRLSQLDCTVTVMFTDIENSTMLAEKYGDTQWMQVLRAHNDIVRKALRKYGGNEIKSQGDGFMLAFPSARRALMCAVAIQQEIDRHGRAHPQEGVRVRIGLHTGEAIAEGGDLFGRHVILAARIAGHAEGGQILVSHLVCELVAGADDLTFDEGEEVELKGLSGTFFVHTAQWGPMAASTLRPEPSGPPMRRPMAVPPPPS
jgi:class 3 adenylate cyclase